MVEPLLTSVNHIEQDGKLTILNQIKFMEFVKNFQKKCLKVENARIFNQDTDLFYVIRSLNISYLEKEKEVENSSNDIIVNILTIPKVIAVFDIYTSEKSISKTYPIKTDKIEVTLYPDLKIGELDDYILNKLKDNFKNSIVLKL